MGDGFRPLLRGCEARDRPRAPLRSSQVRPAAPERTPRHPAGVPGLPEAVTREAYLHEVSSAGFWPGNQAFLGPPSIPMPIPNRPASESDLQRRAPTSTRRPASLSCHMIGSARRQILTPCCSIFCRPPVRPPPRLAEQHDEQQQKNLPELHDLSQSTKALALTAILIPTRTRPSPSASPNSPSLVLRTIAVVIIRV